MTLAFLLEDFGRPKPAPEATSVASEEVEALKLEEFEKGYKAGWDDSLKAQSEDSARVSNELARNLEDLSFTYHEARSQLLTALDPLFAQLVDLVLPELARETLAARVVEELRKAADKAVTQQVEIAAAPAEVGVIEGLVTEDVTFPVVVREDESLREGQVVLRFESGERQIDMEDVLAGIRSAVEGFMTDNAKEIAHG